MADTTSTGTYRAKKLAEAEWVGQKLADLIAGMEPGDRIPTHTDLMDRFQASERMVLQALNSLQDEGKVVRLNGKGTFVTAQNVSASVPPLQSTGTRVDDRTIVAIANPDHSFFDHCMRTLFKHVEAENWLLVCRFLDPTSAQEYTSRQGLDRPLGFIVFSHSLGPLALQLHSAGNRVVLIGAPPQGSNSLVPSVFGDHETGGELAASHLIDIGHRRIAYSGNPPWNQNMRVRGYELAIAKARRAGQDVTSCFIDLSMRNAWKRDPALAIQFFRRPDAPTGITAWNDHEAAQLLAILTKAGIRVPEDVSLVGYDNIPESLAVIPHLTTIDSSVPELVQIAVDILTDDEEQSRSFMVPSTLIVRQSTAPPPAI